MSNKCDCINCVKPVHNTGYVIHTHWYDNIMEIEKRDLCVYHFTYFKTNFYKTVEEAQAEVIARTLTLN